MAKEKLLEIRNLKTYLYKENGVSKAVDGVDIQRSIQERPWE